MYYLKDLCLLCLKSSVTLKNIYHVNSDNVSMLDKLKYTIDLLDNNFHGLSLYICEGCDINLNKTYAFKQQSILNINYLKTYSQQLNTISEKFKYLSVVLDRNRVKQTILDQFSNGHCDEFGNEDIDKKQSNENMDIFETMVQNNIKVADINEKLTLVNQVKEEILVFKREEDIDINSEQFEKQISRTDIKPKVENKLVDEILAENHSKDMPLKCTFCGKICKHKQSLRVHLRIHTGEKPFQCHLCSKTFAGKCNLTRHIRIHIGEKSFKCNLCSKAFFEKQDLIVHVRTHTGEKPFKCHLCSKGFSEKSTLNVHVRTHTGEKPFKCNICAKAFPEKRSLVRHTRIHTGERPFKCHLCPKAFNYTGSLRIHIRTHTGEKPFKCPICEKAFSDKRRMAPHAKIHTSERSFKCHLCSKAFVLQYQLNKHIVTHDDTTISNENMDIFETVVQNNIKVEEIEELELLNQVENDITVFKTEEDIYEDSELFATQISISDIKREVEHE